MGISLAYITVGSREDAETMAHVLIDERLAACVNILNEVRSLYRWQGQVEDAREWVMIAKTTSDRFPALAERAAALHAYETPCILEIPVDRANLAYRTWIETEIRSSSDNGAEPQITKACGLETKP